MIIHFSIGAFCLFLSQVNIPDLIARSRIKYFLSRYLMIFIGSLSIILFFNHVISQAQYISSSKFKIDLGSLRFYLDLGLSHLVYGVFLVYFGLKIKFKDKEKKA